MQPFDQSVFVCRQSRQERRRRHLNLLARLADRTAQHNLELVAATERRLSREQLAGSRHDVDVDVDSIRRVEAFHGRHLLETADYYLAYELVLAWKVSRYLTVRTRVFADVVKFFQHICCLAIQDRRRDRQAVVVDLPSAVQTLDESFEFVDLDRLLGREVAVRHKLAGRLEAVVEADRVDESVGERLDDDRE